MSLVGEALVGEEPEVAHIELVIGGEGGAVEQAFMRSIASPRMGHLSLLAVLEPNLPVKPSTLVVNKVTITNAEQANLMFGPAQAAIARAVIDCVESGVIPKEHIYNHYVIVSVYIDKSAEDKKKIFEYNYEATITAIERAYKNEPKIEYLLEEKDESRHPLY